MPAEQPTAILADTIDYYSRKITAFGASPQGVDWNGEESQLLRFAQLTQLIDTDNGTLNDWGCGYGALLDYLRRHHPGIDYHGIDVAAPMIEAACRAHPQSTPDTFVVADRPARVADYSIASGIFNVRQQHRPDEWLNYLHATLHLLDAYSRRGFAFNCLTAYSDPERMRADLYYADPGALFDYCMRHFSRHVALRHDYPLYEFSIIVRKPCPLQRTGQ